MKKLATLVTTFLLVAIMFMVGSISSSALTSGDYEYEILSTEDMTCRITKNTSRNSEVVIPEKIDGYTVVEIGKQAFKYEAIPGYASGIKRIRFGANIKTIGEKAFDLCLDLEEVYYGGTIDDWCEISFGDGIANPLNFAGKLYINEEIVKDISFSDNVEKIKDFAFYGYEALERVSFSDSLKSIGKSAFSNCSNLKSAPLPGSITEIGNGAFFWCSLSEVVVPGTVKTIGDSAFYRNEYSLLKVEICEGVENLGKSAFAYNPKLKEVELPESLITIGESAFDYCQSLEKIEIHDNVTRIEKNTFSRCENLKEVKLGKNIWFIGNNAFKECTKLESINFPEKISSIGSYAFERAKSLKSVVFPKDLNSIGVCAFEECYKLETVIFEGDFIYEIKSSVFENCAINTLVLPSSVRTIGEDAFKLCDFGDVFFTGSESEWNAISIGENNEELEAANKHFNVGAEDWNSHWGEFVTKVEPTCTVDGIAESTCECGHSKTQPISALGHEFSDEFTVDENPTYNKDGTKSRHCVRGDASIDETFIPKLSIAAQKYTGFYKAKGCWYYFNKGQMVINAWKKDSVSWCFLGADGKMVTNKWVRDSVGWCYVGADGYCVTNKWVADSHGWCYLGADGRMVTNKWVRDSVGWCYVGANGYCVTNQWVKDSVGWCFLGPDGRMVTNAIVTDSHGVCCVGADGYWAFEVLIYDGYGYRYFDKTGYMVTNAWLEIDGEYLYADYDGYLYVVE